VILLIAVFLVAVIAIRNAIYIRKIQARWSELLRGTTGQNLEAVLYDHLREKMRLESDLAAVRKRVEHLEELMSSSKRHLGLVRHDAFEDVGGNQSFAMALYDDHGDGAVLSGIVGRTDSRVYCKPLLNGRSERDLSQEEQRAIREARSVGPKSIVSP
jgi:hypothetical protein